MELLNEYSGLFSLLAVVASVIVPFWIYRKQKKDHLQDLRMNWKQWRIILYFLWDMTIESSLHIKALCKRN